MQELFLRSQSTHTYMHLYLSPHTHIFVQHAHTLTSLPPSQAKTLLSDDYGKDLAGVETLIRRHDELERDLTAIENKLEVLYISLMC